MNRILVIRGGAIGDFILTLPALKAMRQANLRAQIEILGYKHIAELACNRFYADRVRSIEYARLSKFFAKDAELPAELAEDFASFDLIVTYLYDPDQIFENNLRRAGVQQIVQGPAKLNAREHAARQLAKPIEELGISVDDLAAQTYPSNEDRKFAEDFLADLPPPIIAFHPGSGSDRKNWPIQNWIALGNQLLHSSDFHGSILIVSGEADRSQSAQLRSTWSGPRVRFAENLPLPHLAAVLAELAFVGHDSGISHLAAAGGAKCVLLFGPSDPGVWAPQGENVHVIRAIDGNLRTIDIEAVRGTLPL